MRLLNLDQVKALIAVIEYGSFTAAAHALNLTQPAVSLQIQELEGRFGVGLVERAGRRIRPTAAGREMALIGRRLLEEADEAHRIMRRFSEGFMGQVRIGMSMTVLIYLMPPVIRHLKATVPSLELSVQTGFSEGTLQAVRENRLDLGLCNAPQSDKAVDIVEVGTDRLVAIFPPETAGLPEVVTPQIVRQHPIILGHPRSALRTLIADWIETSGPVPRPIMELDNVAGIKSVVGAGLGASLVPLIAIRDEDRAGRLQVRPLEPSLERTLLLVQRKDKADDPAIRHVRAALLANMALQR